MVVALQLVHHTESAVVMYPERPAGVHLFQEDKFALGWMAPGFPLPDTTTHKHAPWQRHIQSEREITPITLCIRVHTSFGVRWFLSLIYIIRSKDFGRLGFKPIASNLRDDVRSFYRSGVRGWTSAFTSSCVPAKVWLLLRTTPR